MNNDIEQYKILMNMYDNEISRFYSRQNIYIGIQLASFAGMMAGLNTLVMVPSLFRISLIFLLTISVITALIALRGLTTHKLMRKIISDFEKDSNGNLRIMELAKKHTTLSLDVNFFLSLALSIGAVIFWIALFVFLEYRSYQIIS